VCAMWLQKSLKKATISLYTHPYIKKTKKSMTEKKIAKLIEIVDSESTDMIIKTLSQKQSIDLVILSSDERHQKLLTRKNQGSTPLLVFEVDSRGNEKYNAISVLRDLVNVSCAEGGCSWTRKSIEQLVKFS